MTNRGNYSLYIMKRGAEMDQKSVELLKGMSREERMEYLENHREILSLDDLDAVNGGTDARVENPNSDVPDERGNYISSLGFICRGKRAC